MKQLAITLVIAFCAFQAQAQESSSPQTLAPFATFSTTRVLNNHSTETLKRKNLDFRVTHRFGDMGGDFGGYHNLWGLDGSSDIRIAFEYGFTDDFMIGFGRSKGGISVRELFDLFGKYRIIKPTSKLPLSLTILGSSAISTMIASSSPTSESAFPKVLHRLRYTTQALIGYKFSDRISAQLVPSYHHRNFVLPDDVNGMVTLGVGTRIKLTQLLAVNLEYTYNQLADRNDMFKDEMGIGLEFDLGGHIFQLDITNSRGIGENQFLSGTKSDIGEGQYRMGFTISRPFKL